MSNKLRSFSKATNPLCIFKWRRYVSFVRLCSNLVTDFIKYKQNYYDDLTEALIEALKENYTLTQLVSTDAYYCKPIKEILERNKKMQEDLLFKKVKVASAVE